MMINNIFKPKYTFIPLTKKKKYLFFFKNKKDLYITISYLIGSIFYLLSLRDIDGTGMQCYLQNNLDCIYALSFLCFISSIIITISMCIIIFKNFKKYHLIIIFIIFLFFFIIDHHNIIVKHGLYNIILFIVSTTILLSLLFLLHFLYYLLKKKKYIVIILIILLFYSLYFNLNKYKLNQFSCEGWEKGLNDSYIDNSSKDYPCIINIPKPHSCYIPEIGPLFDFTRYYRPTCLDPDLLKYEREKVLKDMENVRYFELSEKKRFGYPLTNNKQYHSDFYGTLVFPTNQSLEDDIHNNIILMDLYEKDKNKYYPNISFIPEIELVLTDEGGKIEYHIHRNETLIKEKEEIIKRHTNKFLYKNVFVMFVDTLSRAHFYRKFPNTTNFLNQFTKYETNFTKKNMNVFQYFKYNSIDTYTDPNIRASCYGAKADDKNGTHFVNFFNRNGYITGRANTFCVKESIYNPENISAFDHGTWDHEAMSLAGMKSFYDRLFVSRISTFVPKCLFGEDMNEHIFNYIEAFWATYINEKKMFFYQCLDGHEPTGELIGYLDTRLYNFLNNFYINGYFKDTAFVLFSDHGQHLNGPLYLFDSQDFRFERSLALLLLIVPNDDKLYHNNLYEKIKSNEQTFITPFDIYNTLLYLAFGEDNENYKKNCVSYGDYLFNEINYKNRYCEAPIYGGIIVPRTCNCYHKYI